MKTRASGVSSIIRKLFKLLRKKTFLFFNKFLNIVFSHVIFKNRKVSFLIIGAQKAATTSLYYFLKNHPQCIGGTIKQINFFDNDINFSKGVNWYHKQFNIFNTKLIKNNNVNFFEASPEYLLEEISAQRIFKYNPNIKILVLLRDPVKRAYSAYNMWMQFRETNPAYVWRKTSKFMNSEGKENLRKLLFNKDILPFSYWVNRELELIKRNINYGFPYFVKRGMYAEQLDVYYKQFPKENILVIDDQQLKLNKTKTLDTVASFLSIENIEWEDIKLEDMHIRSYNSDIDTETREKLKKFYAPHNQKLLKYNLKMSWFN